MTLKEAAEILAIIKAAYPNAYKNIGKQEAQGIVSTWASQFAHDSAELVLIAVQKCIAVSIFVPSISEVKSKLRGLYWEAWEAVTYHQNGCKTLSEAEYQTMYKIMKETEKYHDATSTEPTLAELLNGWNAFGGGGEDGQTLRDPGTAPRLK